MFFVFDDFSLIVREPSKSNCWQYFNENLKGIESKLKYIYIYMWFSFFQRCYFNIAGKLRNLIFGNLLIYFN